MLTAYRFLWLVVAVEFLIGRLFTRVGVFMPKNRPVLILYNLLADAGRIAFNVSLLLGLVLLGYTLWRLVATGRRAAVYGPAALAALVALLVLAVPGSPPPPGWSLAAALLAALALAALGALALGRTPSPWARLGLAGALLAHLIWYGVAAAQIALALSGRPGEISAAVPLLRGGELLAMLAPILLAISLRPFQRHQAAAVESRGALLGAGGATAFAAAYVANGDMAGVLAIWSLGFTLAWPAVLYAAAIAAGIYFLARASGPLRVQAAALGILWCTGYALQVNQQHILVLLAWALLAAGTAAAPEAASVPEAAAHPA